MRGNKNALYRAFVSGLLGRGLRGAASSKRVEGRGTLLALGFGCWLVSSHHVAALDAASVQSVGPVELVFSYKRERCAKWDTPDSPARAIRRENGEIVLFATSDVNRPLVGRDFDHLAKRCGSAFQGARDPRPEEFNGQAWLSSLYSEDGKTVHALVHNEVHVDDPGCKMGRTFACWRNSITYAVSHDGGLTFQQPTPPAHVIASLPYAYRPSPARPNQPTGYFNPTNIVKFEGFYYAMFLAETEVGQKSGACVMRTPSLDYLKSWRAWGGRGFDVEFVDPYRQQVPNPESHVCAPVATFPAHALHSLVFHAPSRTFMLLMSFRGPSSPERPQGIYFSSSNDLVSWSAPHLLLAAPTNVSGKDSCATEWMLEANIIDHNSPDRSFSTIGSEAWLYINRYNTTNCAVTDDRDLIRRKVIFK